MTYKERMMPIENEKMEHEYTHQFEQYLQEQFCKKNVNDVKNDVINTRHVNDVINQHMDGHNIVKDLVSQGKAVVTSHPQIENNHLFVIDPDYKAYLIRNESQENVRLRELTEDEYKIAETIYE